MHFTVFLCWLYSFFCVLSFCVFFCVFFVFWSDTYLFSFTQLYSKITSAITSYCTIDKAVTASICNHFFQFLLESFAFSDHRTPRSVAIFFLSFKNDNRPVKCLYRYIQYNMEHNVSMSIIYPVLSNSQALISLIKPREF